MPVAPTWRQAWAAALYGPGGFSVRGDRGPRHDFSTSVTRGPALAEALAVVIGRLTLQGAYDVVDVGSGDGRLLIDLHAALPPDVAARGRFTAVDVAPRPAGLPTAIDWRRTPPTSIHGLVIAHEFLDTVPVDIAEVDRVGMARVVGVDECGGDVVGDVVGAADADWLSRWWPIESAGERADLGRPRDDAWRELTARLTTGLAIAVDYGHQRASRPPTSTLTGWRRGRRVDPVPDGSCDLTAHVAMDACAQPGDLLMTQREALARLEPATGAGAGDPRARLQVLAEASRRSSLRDPLGLGGYLWLIHAAGGTDVGAVFAAGE